MKVMECPACVSYLNGHRDEVITISQSVSDFMEDTTPQKVILAYISAYHHSDHNEDKVFEKYVLGVGLDNISQD
jgi:hypothetical protein